MLRVGESKSSPLGSGHRADEPTYFGSESKQITLEGRCLAGSGHEEEETHSSIRFLRKRMLMLSLTKGR